MKPEKITAVPSHSSPPDDGITYLQIDRQWWRLDCDLYSGVDLRAFDDTPIPDDRDLWLIVPGANDVKIGDDDLVPVRTSGLRLFTTPKYINASRATSFAELNMEARIRNIRTLAAAEREHTAINVFGEPLGRPSWNDLEAILDLMIRNDDAPKCQQVSEEKGKLCRDKKRP